MNAEDFDLAERIYGHARRMTAGLEVPEIAVGDLEDSLREARALRAIRILCAQGRFVRCENAAGELQGWEVR